MDGTLLYSVKSEDNFFNCRYFEQLVSMMLSHIFDISFLSYVGKSMQIYITLGDVRDIVGSEKHVRNI